MYDDFYGDIVDAQDYFDNRLHEVAWSEATAADRKKALVAATNIIDQLNFKGEKAAVATLLAGDPDATEEEKRVADQTQALEFPRGTDTVVPEAIKTASYEMAHSLLDGKDPEIELEALGITSQGYSSLRTTYNRQQSPIEHLVNFVPSPMAWRWIRPFLRDEDAIKLARIS